MRPTYLKFRDPRERTGEYLYPSVNNIGRTLQFNEHGPIKGTFPRSQRFQHIEDQKKRTGGNVGPGTYELQKDIDLGTFPKMVAPYAVDNEWDYFYVEQSIVRQPKRPNSEQRNRFCPRHDQSMHKSRVSNLNRSLVDIDHSIGKLDMDLSTPKYSTRRPNDGSQSTTNKRGLNTSLQRDSHLPYSTLDANPPKRPSRPSTGNGNKKKRANPDYSFDIMFMGQRESLEKDSDRSPVRPLSNGRNTRGHSANRSAIDHEIFEEALNSSIRARPYNPNVNEPKSHRAQPFTVYITGGRSPYSQRLGSRQQPNRLNIKELTAKYLPSNQ